MEYLKCKFSVVFDDANVEVKFDTKTIHKRENFSNLGLSSRVVGTSMIISQSHLGDMDEIEAYPLRLLKCGCGLYDTQDEGSEIEMAWACVEKVHRCPSEE
ncbi:hypothetical protein H5410_028347, partial [Solanum commersonii]